MRAILFVAAPGVEPVAESFNGRKRMAAGAEDAAGTNLLKKDGFVGRLVLHQIVGQKNMGYVCALDFFFVQPFGNVQS